MTPYLPHVAWKKNEVAGAWVILGSLGLGLTLSILYSAEILLRRLRLSLAAGVLFLIVYAFGMALVSQFFAWQSGLTGAGGAPLTLNMLFLAAALLGLLLRAAVVAGCAASWLPAPLVQVTSLARADVLFLYRDLASPKLSALLMYALSPLAWWLLGIALLGLWLDGGGSFWRLALLLALLLLLLARAVLGAWAAWCAWGEFREALGSYDKSGLKETRWYLFFSGLPLAGLLCMYAFLFAAQRVQQDALAKEMERAEPELIAKLRACQGPPLEDFQNAAPLYKQATAGLSPLNDYGIISDAWRTPEAARWLRLSQSAVPPLIAATDLDRCEYLHDYGADINAFDKSLPNLLDVRNLANMLMLDARMAALDRDWPTVLKNTRRCLQIARHIHQQPCILTCMVAVGIEDQAVTALLPTLLWHHDGPAEDAMLAEAQALLLEYESRRGAPLARVVGIYRYESEWRLSREQVVRAEAWPGEPSGLALPMRQPLIAWLERETRRRWNEALYRAAASKNPLDDGERMRAEFENVPSALRGMFMSMRTLNADVDTLCELRLARAALAVARYQMKHKRWPSDLQECVPEFLAEVPIDPYRPREVLHFSNNPPRVWSASGPGLETSHRTYEFTNDYLYADFMGGYNNDDKIFCLTPPTFAYGASSYYQDQGPLLIETQAQFLSDPDPLVRREAAQRLRREGSRAWQAQPAVLKLAGDADPEFRMWAAFLLGTMANPTPEALKELERLKQDADADVQRFARESLRWLKKAKK
ncbi:MAG: HEAT repeat domain-containing protein [Planctomycetes bacterium]|nr:HEAT repeat domain-containing protein [Planctomycetota bacterium]